MRRSEIIHDIRETLREHNIDSEISDRHIMFLLRTKRAKYLEQRETKDLSRDISELTQSLYLTTELTDSSRIPATPTNTNVLRTVKSIPNIVGRNIFSHLDVRPKDITGQEIQVISKQRISEVSHAPAGFTYCFKEDNGKLYFFSPDTITLPEVVVQVILENPEDIVELNELTTNLEEYPITGKIWEIIRPEILQLLGVSESIEMDLTNNKTDDKTSQK